MIKFYCYLWLYFRLDVKNVIRDIFEMILFYFVLYGEGFYIIKVLVIEFNFVYYIDEELFVIYENFI